MSEAGTLVERRREDAIEIITLSRPEKLNALSLALKKELSEAIAAANADEGTQAIVLTGAGRAFCAGADLKDLSPRVGPAYQAELRDLQRSLIEAIALSDKVAVAAVNGPCVGGGLSLALACDLIVAAQDAYFSVPQLTRVGVAPDLGLIHTLPRAIGAKRAQAAFMLGLRFDAATAERWGLVWEVVGDAEEAVARAIALAGEAAANREGVAATKRLAAGPAQGALSELLEAEAAEVALLRQSDAHRGAVGRFADR